MTRLDSLFQWRDQINRHLPSLSEPQAAELALWSTGMVLAHRATLSAVSLHLSEWLDQAVNTVRQRLRDWYLPAANKSGRRRAEWNPDRCFADLFAWVVSLLPKDGDGGGGGDRRLMLALDACNLKDRLTILCVSVLVGGCAIPVAWRCVIANEPEAWKPHWLALLERIRSALTREPQEPSEPSEPSENEGEREVLVLADRGLWAPWLFTAIKTIGWHPLLRINGDQNGQFLAYRRRTRTDDDRPRGANPQQWRPMSSFVPPRGGEVRIKGEAFKSQELPSTLMIFWGESAKEPWYLLTDLDWSPCEGRIYGMRFWIEHQFKKIKSDGWHWERSRITDPVRVERMWVAYAVSLLWTLSFGSQAEVRQAEARQAETGQAMIRAPHSGDKSRARDTRQQQTRTDNGTLVRSFSWFARGIATLASRIALGLSLECQRMCTPTSTREYNTS